MAYKTKTQSPGQKKQDRASDTRRKILLGALILHRLQDKKNPKLSQNLRIWLQNNLSGFLTRDVDRQLFADILEGKQNEQPTKSQQK